MHYTIDRWFGQTLIKTVSLVHYGILFTAARSRFSQFWTQLILLQLLPRLLKKGKIIQQKGLINVAVGA